MFDALEERDESNGQVSGARIRELLNSFQDTILTGVDKRLVALQSVQGIDDHGQGSLPFSEEVLGEVPTFNNGRYLAFCYAEGENKDQRF